jgi:hypothetical protein
MSVPLAQEELPDLCCWQRGAAAAAESQRRRFTPRDQAFVCFGGENSGGVLTHIRPQGAQLWTAVAQHQYPSVNCFTIWMTLYFRRGKVSTSLKEHMRYCQALRISTEFKAVIRIFQNLKIQLPNQDKQQAQLGQKSTKRHMQDNAAVDGTQEHQSGDNDV